MIALKLGAFDNNGLLETQEWNDSCSSLGLGIIIEVVVN